MMSRTAGEMRCFTYAFQRRSVRKAGDVFRQLSRNVCARVLFVAIAGISFLCAPASNAPAASSVLSAGSPIIPAYRGDYASAIVVEAETGAVLFSSSPDVVRSPASLTKLMTGLLVFEALEQGRFSIEDSLVVPKEVEAVHGSRVRLWTGERVSIHDALCALFIASGNDAATALACHVGRSEDAFVRMMNERAGELGMYRTRFVNPHGLDNGRHAGNVSTARDMAALSRALLRHPMALGISGMPIHKIRETQIIHNTNRMLGRFPGVDGLKTGYTSKAGFCLSATAERNGLRIVAIILGSPAGDRRFSEAAGLINGAFNEYQLVPMIRCGQYLGKSLMVRNGSPSRVRLKAGSDVLVLLPRENRDKVRLEVEAPIAVQAPIEPGAMLGSVRVFIADSLAAEGPAVAASQVRKAGFIDRLGQHFGLSD